MSDRYLQGTEWQIPFPRWALSEQRVDEEGDGLPGGARTVIGECGPAVRCQPHRALRSQELIPRREACRGQLHPACPCCGDALSGPEEPWDWLP